MRKIDSLLAQLSHLASANESVMDLLYRLNLQRRGNMKNIMRSKENQLLTAESGFDSNWTFLHSKLVFEEQTYMCEVRLVASHRCKIVPKSVRELQNGDLVVSSYAGCGVRVRAYHREPFRKISKHEFTVTGGEYAQIHARNNYCYAREQGVQNFIDLRFQYSSFRVI